MSDADSGRSTAAQSGQVVERSGIGKSADHIVGDLSTTLDGEPSEGKVGSLGWAKGDCALKETERERERERERELHNNYHTLSTVDFRVFSAIPTARACMLYYTVTASNKHVHTCIWTVYM